MKILHFGNIWRGFGGTDETVRTVLREMAKLGHKVTALTYDNPNQKITQKRECKEELIEEIKLDGATEDIDRYNEVCKHIDDDTVVYTVLNAHSELWKMLADRGVALVHEYNMPKMNLHLCNKTGVRFVFNSKWTQSYYPALDGKVIYPLIDFSKFKPDHAEKDGTIGMINPCVVKGVKIVKRLAQNMKETKFLLCGGWGHMTVGGIVRIPGSPNVKYLRNTENVSDFYNAFDILLVPSQSHHIFSLNHDESYGRVVLEGFEHDCAVLASYKDGLVDAMEDGGFLVGNYGEWQHWKDAILKVQDNIDFYRKAGQARLARYKDNYPMQVRAYENVFKEALDDASKS